MGIATPTHMTMRLRMQGWRRKTRQHHRLTLLWLSTVIFR
jgi:hypothetical protein